MTDSTRGQEKMIPNRYFRDFYPELYSKAYPERKVPAHEMSVGMYALTLGIARKQDCTRTCGISTEHSM